MGSKIFSWLGMLRRASKVLPRSACITLYNAVVLSLFVYCACIWNGFGKDCKDELLKSAYRIGGP